jgi:tetratricopeptide (TPR) repeat protein
VFETHVDLLSYLGESAEVDQLLDDYGRTVVEKDARYISYCEMRSFSKWVRGDFSEAVEWGRTGKDLAVSSGVDTHRDISHTLALAERDAGRPELALSVFLRDLSLSQLKDPEELDEDRGGAYYGNIGRCLHLMGQSDAALTCYQKSALLIEKDPRNQRVLNQGYIRLWIGELLIARQQFRLARVFFKAAHLKWRDVYPARAAGALDLARQIEQRSVLKRTDDDAVERTCLDWILGRNLDSEFA